MGNYGLGYAWGILGSVILVAFAIALIPKIFYLITLQKALQAVSPENRKMEPGLVWLLLIPIFSWIWNFFVVDAIGTSFKREYDKYAMFQNEKPTYNLGLTMSILSCCWIVPILGGLAGIASFVIWIIYWVKVNEVKNEIINIAANKNLNPGETSIFV